MDNESLFLMIDNFCQFHWRKFVWLRFN